MKPALRRIAALGMIAALATFGVAAVLPHIHHDDADARDCMFCLAHFSGAEPAVVAVGPLCIGVAPATLELSCSLFVPQNTPLDIRGRAPPALFSLA